MWHYRARLLREPRFQIFGRLTNEYIVDMFSRDLESRLAYIRTNQERIRREDATLMGLSNVEANENIYLPASFLGSNRWASEQISDSLAIAAAFGSPTFFITMTCNPEWPEIQSQLRPGQDFTDIPMVVVRVFKRKLALLEKALKRMFPNSGPQLYLIHSVEFQKRGLPHAHLLCKFAKDCVHPSDIDMIVSAEIPEDPVDAALVRKFMMHNHPPATRPPSKYCQRESAEGVRTCRFKYPQKLQNETTIDVEGRVQYRPRKPGDEMVVAYCLELLRKFQCHLNFEVANTSHIFQYLFKYIHKGSPFIHLTLFTHAHRDFSAADSARYKLKVTADNGVSTETIDEIDDYWNARYLSAGEAAWRILGFQVAKKHPAVSALPIHLPGSTSNRQYSRKAGLVPTLSQLERYFLRPVGSFQEEQSGTERSFTSLTYAEYYSLFRLVKYDAANEIKPQYFREQPNTTGASRMHVVLRSSAHTHLSRIQTVRPSQGELFYLRAILQNKPCSSFVDAITVDNTQYLTFQDATIALGLFADKNEATYAMLEAVQTLRTPRQLRLLFVHLLVNDCVDSPITMWDAFQNELSYDFVLHANNIVHIGLNSALDDLARLLEEYGKYLGDFGLPEPIFHSREVEHELLSWGDRKSVV